jgi:hypothetical protein
MRAQNHRRAWRRVETLICVHLNLEQLFLFSVFFLRSLRSFAATPPYIFSHSVWNTPGLSMRS